MYRANHPTHKDNLELRNPLLQKRKVKKDSQYNLQGKFKKLTLNK